MFKLRTHDRQLRDVLGATVYQGNDLDIVITHFKVGVAECFPRWTVHFEGDENGGQMFALDVSIMAGGTWAGDHNLLATIERESEVE